MIRIGVQTTGVSTVHTGTTHGRDYDREASRGGGCQLREFG